MLVFGGVTKIHHGTRRHRRLVDQKKRPLLKPMKGKKTWMKVRIPREDWGTLGKLRGITTPPAKGSPTKIMFQFEKENHLNQIHIFLGNL